MPVQMPVFIACVDFFGGIFLALGLLSRSMSFVLTVNLIMAYVIADREALLKDWNLEDALGAGDHAVGVSVLQPLYAKMKDKPVSVDLATLWAQLGVQSDGAIVGFDDSATLAAIRRAITMAESNGVEERSLFLRPFAVIVGRAVGPPSLGWRSKPRLGGSISS